MNGVIDFLDPNHFSFFVYRGGSGGEFILFSLTNESELLYPLSLKKIDPVLNRYYLDYPDALSNVVFGTEHINADVANNELSNIIRSKRQYVLRGHKLFKFQKLPNTIWHLNFKDDVYSEYVNWLEVIKVMFEEINIANIQGDLNTYSVATNMSFILDSIKSYILTNKPNKVYYGHIYIACKILRTTPLNEIFSLSEEEMLKLLYESYIETFTNVSDNVVSLQYSELFKKDGQFQDTFKLKTDNFYHQMIGWHMRNLEVMGRFGVDTEPFNFHLS